MHYLVDKYILMFGNLKVLQYVAYATPPFWTPPTKASCVIHFVYFVTYQVIYLRHEMKDTRILIL